ncbi:asparagine synthase [Sphingomonas sp. C8-2]|jgi:asparagine synthase (glutamine-hydrolysing)|nr:asparagine synthase [Sphingomonas sp. C8-2]
MSCFAALFRRDGAPMAEALPDRAEAALRARGPCHWRRGRTWAMAASGPIAGAGDATMLVAADARLDNRRDLIAVLRLHPGSSDADVILAAYRRWDGDCVRRLAGDFAFVIRDERRGSIFCARDHFGIRPFYYTLADRLFAAAGITRFLTALPAVGDAIDEQGLADLLAGGYADGAITLHHGIRRLPPGHSLTLTEAGARIARYWHPQEVPVEERADAAEGFRALFAEAVARRRARGDGVGVMLSGGLDSSSVAVQAAQGVRPMPSLSMMLDDTPGWNERPFIETVLGQGGFDPRFIDAADHDPVAELPELIDEQEGPFVAYNASLSRRLYRRARAAGLTRLLDGHGGDEVVSHGLGRLNELAARGDWRRLWRESAGIAGLYGVGRWSILSPYLSHNRFVRFARGRQARIQARLGWGGPAEAAGYALVEPGLAARVDLADRHADRSIKGSARHCERDVHVELLTAPQQGYAFEVLDRMGAAAGVAALYPFYDLRLVEYCLSLPSHHKLNDGLPRYVLRQAMAGLLPDPVRLRPDKYDFAPALADALLRRRAALADLAGRDRAGIGRFVDMDVARNAIGRLLDQGRAVDGASLFAAWRVLMLAVWLDHRERVSGSWTDIAEREAAA